MTRDALLHDREIATLVERFGVGDLRTRGVLLVDDERMNLTVLRGLLEDAWTVHEAGSGDEALAVAAEVPLDVVVADQRMPGMTGVELLQELRVRRPDVAGVVLTGFADLAALESAINRAGAFHFLRKPVEAAEILQIVDRASAWAAQRRTIERLVRLLADRSVALADSLARVEAQQRMLLDLERLGTIGQLTAGVTHDLRNVMVALRAAEWQIAETAIAPALRETMTAGIGGIDNLLRTLSTLHEFARTGTLELQLSSVEPAAVVKDALAIARMDLAFRLRDVAAEVPDRLPRIAADRQKVTQVLVNLVRNALHATEGRAAVRVSARAPSAGEVAFAVEDEGTGIPAALRARLFEPFVSTKGEGGLGLGLYMSRLIVESHGGRIAVSDRGGGGSRFEVVLPAVPAGSP